MTSEQWNYFKTFKAEFKTKCEQWLNQIDNSIIELQDKIRKLDNVPFYKIENPIVYNSDLENMTINSDIKLILIADNPGKEEQLNINKKYLCGLSGKIATNYFKNHLELNIDFRQNVIILNKTPIHTAKTKELKFLTEKSENIKEIMTESQKYMAFEMTKLQKVFDVPVWIIGYSELTEKGIFNVYRKTLLKYYNTEEFKKNYDKLFIFQHFSMNRFSIELSEFIKKNECLRSLTLQKQIETLGSFHKEKILGKL